MSPVEQVEFVGASISPISWLLVHHDEAPPSPSPSGKGKKQGGPAFDGGTKTELLWHAKTRDRDCHRT